MKIGILGTRGIPNHHGGFEQFASYFAQYAQYKGHDVIVYNSSNHPYKESYYKNIKIVHCYDPEHKIGTVGQFIYDFNCILNSRKHNFDIILQLGYTSSALWFKLHPKKPVLITNMDGLEWKRSKYSKTVQKFLVKSERWAVKNSDYLIADSVGIQKYLKEKYNVESSFIAYGADLFNKPNVSILKNYKIEPFKYNMLIARMEPENNIEVILDGVSQSSIKTPFLVVGNNNINDFGKRLTKKYKKHKHIRFIGGVYNQEHLNNLRYYSNLYFHGHSVGGTNPSLLEAMASNALIIAHDNIFNKAILRNNGLYFSTSDNVRIIINSIEKCNYQKFLDTNREEIITNYSWENISEKYLDLFESLSTFK